MERRTEHELKQLALDVRAGRIFGTWNLSDMSDAGLVFMPLALGAELDDDVGHVFEYLEKAGSRGINGYPSFFSCQLLHKDDAPLLKGYLDALVKQEQEFIGTT